MNDDYEFLDDETSSERSEDNESLSGISDEDIEEESRQIGEKQLRYYQLVNDKYQTIVQFNAGEMDIDIFFGHIKNINNQIEEIRSSEEDFEQTLIFRENELAEMLDEFTNKIKKVLNLNKKVRADFLDYFDLQRASSLRILIKDLQDKYNQIEETEEEPEVNNIYGESLEDLCEEKRIELENQAQQNGIIKPSPENFESDKDYQKALSNYYDRLAIFYVYHPLEQEEYNKMKAVAKEHGIVKPKKSSPTYDEDIQEYYKKVSQLLPGYVFKMNATSIGSTYEKLDIPDLIQKTKNDLELLQELPIQVPIEDIEYQLKMKKISNLLGKLKKSHLIDCILDSGVNVQSKAFIDEVNGGDYITKKIENLELVSGTSKRKKYAEIATPLPTVITRKSDPVQFQIKVAKEKEKIELKKMKLEKDALNTQHKRLLRELLEKYNKLKKKESSIPEVIPQFLRTLHKKRLVNSLQRDIPIELTPFIQDTVQRMEEYIFKLTPRFFDYTNKIEDILFIFDNYPGFKIKLLEPKPFTRRKDNSIVYKTEIDVYQLVLFEKELSYEARLHIFPVNVHVRKAVLSMIQVEIFKQDTFKSKILNKILSEKFSKKLEQILFETSNNQSVYNLNIQLLMKLIKKVKDMLKQVIYGKLSIEIIIQILNIGRSEISEKRKTLHKWLDNEEEETKNLNLADYLKKTFIGPINNEFYDKFTLNELNVFINDTRNEIRRLRSIGYSPQIKELEDKLKALQKEYNRKKVRTFADYKKRYTQFLNEKYGKTPLPAYPDRKVISLNYNYVNIEVINEAIQAYKRKLILYDQDNFKRQPYVSRIENVKFAGHDYFPYLKKSEQPDFYEITTAAYKPPEEKLVWLFMNPQEEKVNFNLSTDETGYVKVNLSTEQNVKVVLAPKETQLDPDVEKRGLLITYLELYDLNVLYSKEKINNQYILKPELYQRIKNEIVAKINQYTTSSYETINKKYYTLALQQFLNFLGVNNQGDNNTELLKRLVDNWPKSYVQTKFKDYYGEDLFFKILQTKSPFDFYNFMEMRNYDQLVKKNTRKEASEFRKPMILFNEAKGTFGDQAVDGLLYQVEFLDKDHATGNPIPQTKIIMEKDPRTAKWLAVNKTTYKRGPYAFILRFIGTNQISRAQEIWMEVPKGAVKMYTYDYDSCSRFKTQKDCYGPGLNNSTCVYQNGRCQADYTKSFVFGKKKIKKSKNKIKVKRNGKTFR